ncbi:MAG: cysteine desulfurase family protein [Candidatus Obscuribacterales bacterium]
MSREQNERIFLDYQSTTPVDPRVKDVVVECMVDKFGNASSVDHDYGDQAERLVNSARKQIGLLLDASPRQVIFTSGATESINLGIVGFLNGITHQERIRILSSPIEHPAVLETLKSIQRSSGGRIGIQWIPVDLAGQIDEDFLDSELKRGVDLVCIMAANNEIGTIYPIERIARKCRESGARFFCDATQAVGKTPIEFRTWGISLLAFSAHKIYGPKGVGALLVGKDCKLSPVFFGGSQENGIRPGTLNVPGIAGLGQACEFRRLEMGIDESRIAELRDLLWSLLARKISSIHLNGDRSARLSGNLHFSIPDIPNSAVIARVRSRLAISTGAACSSGIVAPSHVLQAIGLSEESIEGSFRIGIGKFTSERDVRNAASIFIDAVHSVQQKLGICSDSKITDGVAK